MAEVSAYSMDLYCDEGCDEPGYGMWPDPHGHKYDEFPHSYIGNTRGGCLKQARRQGWKFCKDGRILCPKHSGKEPTQ